MAPKFPDLIFPDVPHRQAAPCLRCNYNKVNCWLGKRMKKLTGEKPAPAQPARYNYYKVNCWLGKRMKKLMAEKSAPAEPQEQATSITIENDSDEESQPDYMNRELKKSVEEGDIECFVTTLEKLVCTEEALQASNVLKQRDIKRNTYLHLAAMYGRYELIGYLFINVSVSVKPLLRQKNEEGDNPLHIAVRKGHFAVAELLLRRDVDSRVTIASQKNNKGNMPLQEALLHNHQHLVNLLLSWDFGFSSSNVNNQGKSAIYLSVESGDVKAFNAMFKAKRFETTTNLEGLLEENLMKGRSLLHAAISRKDKVMLQEILAKGMHMLLHVKDENGCSPIEFASITGFHDGEDLLRQELNKENNDTLDAWVNQQVLDHNPDASCSSLVEDKDREGVAKSSEWDGRHERMRKLLSNVMLPQQQQQQQSQGMCHHCMDLGLYEAAKKGNVDEFISVLEQYSVEKGLALPTIFGQLTPLKNTFLHVASRHGHKDLLLLIIQYFPSLLVRENSDCNTALHLAAGIGCLDIVKIIVTFGNVKLRKELTLNINLENDEGRTPLQVAHYKLKTEVVEFFIKEYVEEAYHVNKKGTSLLYSVILNGETERLKAIFNTVSNYVDQNVLDDQLIKGRSLVLAAIWSRKIDILQELARQKPELMNVKDEHAQKLVHFAEYLGFHEGANYLRREFKLEIVLDNIGATVISELPLQSYSLDTYSLTLIEMVDPKIENIRLSMHLNRRHERMEKILCNNELQHMPQEDQHEHPMDIKLYEAAKNGDVDSFISALEEFSEANRTSLQTISKQKTHIGNTFLHVAANCGKKDLTGFIVHYFRNLLEVTNNRRNTANHEASRAGHLEVLDILVRFNNYHHHLQVSQDPDTSAKYISTFNWENNTSLHEAFRNNKRHVIDYLIESSVEEAYQVDHDGKSGLYLAAEAGMVEVVKTILSNLNAYDKDIFVSAYTNGKSLINAAIQSRSIVTLQEIARKIPEQIHVVNEDGQTPLLCAVSTGFLEGVECLLDEFKMDASHMDSTGFYLVHVASKSGNVHILQKLMQKVPDAGLSRTRKGQNILHVAAMYGKENVVRFILQTTDLKFLINETDDDGNTPLHLATINCHLNVVSCLTWNRTVNVTSVNKDGLTALDAAERYMEPRTSFQQRVTWSVLISAGVPRAGNKYRLSSSKKHDLSRKDERYNLDYSKDRVNTLLLVATLVATVTFAAGFTMPGGYNNSEPKQGQATLLHKHLLQTFVMCDTIALYSAVMVAVSLIWAQLGDPTLVLNALRFAVPLLGLSLTAMSIAFLAGVSLVVGNLTWLAGFVMIFGIISLTSILALLIPLVFSYSSTSPVYRYITYYPFQLLVWASKFN